MRVDRQDLELSETPEKQVVQVPAEVRELAECPVLRATLVALEAPARWEPKDNRDSLEERETLAPLGKWVPLAFLEIPDRLVLGLVVEFKV